MNTRALIGAALAAATLVLAAPAAPALADGFTLSLSASATPVVGQPMIVQATGSIPADEVGQPWTYWFSLDAIPASATTTCPADRWEGVQFATAFGGSIVVLSQRQSPDAAGNFTIPVAITPSAAGGVLLCGYTDDGEAGTLARASLILNIQPAPSGPAQGAPPAGQAPGEPAPPTRPGAESRPPSPPRFAAEGIKGCRALLAGTKARTCIRHIVRKANARCRKQGSRDGRTRCLRAVRRAVRSSS